VPDELDHEVTSEGHIGGNEHVPSRSLHPPLRRDAVIARYQQSTRGPPGPSGAGGAEVTCPATPFLQAAVTSKVAAHSVERTGPAGPGRGETTCSAP
jgi:hypothetical protein